MTMRRSLWLMGIFAALFIAGCAINTGARGQKDTYSSIWHGRLALKVDADNATLHRPGQSFSAAFELQGHAQQGELQLLTPLGTTAARVTWTTTSATLESGGETHAYADLQALLRHLLGTDVPVIALFSWLDGQAVALEGWQVDLTQRTQGKIIAHRLHPGPVAELRLVLED